MEERESLKRQIELLQNLINNHKSVHGDTPCARDQQRHSAAATSARGRGHSTSAVHPHSSRGGLYAPQSRGSWRKTYSLSNKHPQASVRHPLASTSSSVHQLCSVSSTSLPSHSKGENSGNIVTASLASGIPEQTQDGHINSITGRVAADEKHTDTLKKAGGTLSQHGDEKEDSSSTGTIVQRNRLHRLTQQKTKSRSTVLPEKVSGSSEMPSPVKASTSTSLQRKATLTKSSKETKPTVTTTATANTTPLSVLSNISKQPSNNPASHTSQGQVSASFVKKSKFTWVKSQNMGAMEPQQASSISSPTGKTVTNASTSVSKAGVAGRTSPSFSVKRTPGKKFPRKLSLVNIAHKSSKYKWVSSSAGAQTKTPRKVLSPKAPQRALEKGEVTKKLRSPSTPSAKMKKGAVGPSTSSSLSSRYRWKAGGQSTSAAVAGGATVARRRSAFHWTSEKSTKGVKGGLVVSPSVTQRSSPMSSPSTGGFKLRSRMKIIRKSANSSTRSPMGVRRTPTRELVSYGRHKLRRLPPSSSRTSATSSCSFHRSPASQRVFRTRYKMVTRPGSSTAHNLHYNLTLSWRAKRIQSARSFLQSRMRVPHDRHPSSTHHWRGSSMCWIRGSLYRVSANKLSRTVASNMSINRTGRSFSNTQVSPTSPTFNRPFSSRHLASRAVQRSLAIIRHARQKKPQKQYCMYYNRFGKCNRGNSCPYIHDPDKVAVCTRFLRGTCKQADGTCPFSHKVAKEKMPVCSYFLKGICNNSDCPYSHVYVSRKAEVCKDFVKGYCPDGQKCKKKHTLVCPDFSKTGSCPQGARCKLQHRHRAKRSASSGTTTPAKRSRTKEPSKRPRLSVVMPQGSQVASGTPTKHPLELPSFISLSSSPEEADTPDTLPTSQVKEKKLQIKPRL